MSRLISASVWQPGGWPLLTQITSTMEQELNQPLCFFLPAFSKCLASSLENVQPQQQQCTFACFLSGSCCSEHIMYVNLLHLQGNSEPRYYLLKSPLWRHWSHEDRQHPESRSSGTVVAVSPASTSISLFVVCEGGMCLLSPFTMWVLGMKLGLPGLTARLRQAYFPPPIKMCLIIL